MIAAPSSQSDKEGAPRTWSASRRDDAGHGGARARLGEKADDHVARVGGIDHLVDEVPRGRAVGQGVELPLGEQRLPSRRALLGG